MITLKIKVGITGSTGFIGSHLYNYIELQDNIELVKFDKSFFNDKTKLESFVKECDVIVHLAAMNRHPDPEVIYNTNIELINGLIGACESTNATPKILFSSSTQQENENHYGRSKKEGGLLLSKWAKSSKSSFISMVIPNVFGPFGKPFYNSVVATFCHQLTHGEQPSITGDGMLNLIYVNELVEDIYELITSEVEGEVMIQNRHSILVSELLLKLEEFKKEYLDEGKFPNLDQSSFTLALFNTFRCYIEHTHYPVNFTKHTDNRGSFTEIVRANTSGQFSYSTTKPGITRGDHFHTRKAERFSVIQGKAKISIRKINTNEVIDYYLDGDVPAYVDMPIWYTHNITNVGTEELISLFWINEPYDQENPDTYFIKV